MLRLSSAIFIALFSLSALARVSMEEKRNRVRLLEKLSRTIPALHIAGYHRELNYEEQNLSLEDRAENEARLTSEQIKTQVISSYEKAFAETSDKEQAKTTVREAIDKDLELAEPELRDEFKEIAYKALEDVANGIISSDDSFSDPLQKYMMSEVKERSNFLNVEGMLDNSSAASPIANNSKDGERRTYKSKAEILESLASERENVRWLSTSSITTNSSVTKRLDANVSYTLKIKFLGADLSGGPKIDFHRHYESRVIILSEGMTPGVNPNGDFDFNKRDRAGQVITSGGHPQKRYVSFFCELALNFNTEYSGSGNFSIMGVGGGASYGHRYSNEVTMTSRRILVPEYVGNQSVTMPYLQNLCLNDFLNTRINNQMTVKQALNIQMRNIIASLRFSHPMTKCIRDDQCLAWFNNGMKGVAGNTVVPRCLEESREHYFACAVRSKVNHKCPVFQGGKHTSDGQFEYPCDRGLYCKVVKDGGWFKSMNIFDYAEGRCVPRKK
ncbi:MAG: hypothetical protein ACJ76H_04540 [Bacteriovoracaceae bacterium]